MGNIFVSHCARYAHVVFTGFPLFPVQSLLDLGFTTGDITEQVYLGGRDCPVFNFTDCQLQVCSISILRDDS